MSKTAFIFDEVCIPPSCQIGRHSHPQWELSTVICGAGTRTIGNLTEPMEEREVILIPPHVPHVWQFDPSHTDVEGNIANITIFFETSTLRGLSAVFPELKSCIEKLESLSEAINLKDDNRCKVYELLQSLRGLSPVVRVPKIIELLLIIADSDLSIFAGRRSAFSRVEQRLDRVRVFCKCNYGRIISLDEVAAHVNMNKSSFCTFMRNHAGMSLSEYVNDIRLNRAMEMLHHTDKNIADIAYDTGFASVTYFNRLFRRKFNCTPKSIRQNYNSSTPCFRRGSLPKSVQTEFK